MDGFQWKPEASVLTCGHALAARAGEAAMQRFVGLEKGQRLLQIHCVDQSLLLAISVSRTAASV